LLIAEVTFGKETAMNRRYWIAALTLLALVGMSAVCSSTTQPAEDPVEQATAESTQTDEPGQTPAAAQTPPPIAEGDEAQGDDAKETPQAPKLPCQDAGDYFHKGEYKEALIAYVNLLKENAELECAYNRIGESISLMIATPAYTDAQDTLIDLGLEKTAWAFFPETEAENSPVMLEQRGIYTNTYFLVRILDDLGHTDAASNVLRDTIVKELRDCKECNPESCDPKACMEDWHGLEYLLADRFEVARILADDLGNDKAAREEVKRVVKEHPAAKVPDELQYLFMGDLSKPLNLFKNGLYWRALTEYRATRHWPAVLLGVLLLPLVCVVFWRLICLYLNILATLGRPKLDIGDFQGELESGGAKNVSALMEEVIVGLYTEVDAPRRVHLVSAPMEPLNVPETVKSSVPSHINILLALIDWALPQPVIILQGHLHPPGDRGVGLTLALVDKRTGRILDEHTMWQEDYGPDSDPGSQSDKNSSIAHHYRLAKPAAVWTLYKYNEHGRARGTKLLGAKDWRSYAFFLAGVDWRLQRNNKQARQMFVEALNCDVNNQGAMLNLATLDVEEAARTDGVYERAIDRLTKAQGDASRNSWLRTKEKDVHENPVWYKATYQLAAVYSYCGESGKAKKQAKDLWMATHQTRQELNKAGGARLQRKNLRAFLESIEPLAVTLYAGIHKIYPESGDGSDNKDRRGCWERFIAWLNAEDMENGGSGETAAKAPAERESSNGSDEVFPRVEISRQMQGIIAQWSKQNYRVHYNLACYRSVLGSSKEGKNEREAREQYEEAIKHLRYAFERRGDIVQWAKHDPALRGVRETKILRTEGDTWTFADEFEKLWNEHNDTPTQENP
jgi:tetratricopeptide (TPR) repeat protein